MKLIFIHGSGGSKESWHYQTQFFQDSEALDLPGHPTGKQIDTISGYAEWLNGHIRKRGYRDVVLAGHSLGGGIILQYALSYPADVKGLISVGSGLRLRVHPFFLKALEEAIANPAQFEAFIQPSYEHVDPELAKLLKKRVMENGPAVMLNDMRACDTFDIMEKAKDIAVPVLALCGTDDVMTPPKYSHYMTQHLPNARLCVIEGGTHFMFAEKPDAVNRAIEAFLHSL
ncbi:MAG: alpha/beta hydrolase [Desulfobacterales bacterium]